MASAEARDHGVVEAFERLVVKAAMQIVVHDDPMPGVWFCGRCPYANVGSVCTKCWAPRYEGTPFEPARSSIEQEVGR